ncbi:hypothetical protein BBK14_01730 [Parafrankia soli]|uniref:Uncharacterized protein n=1 Tax=Parafrankia soli TaxID=2599596 RepID=A0A1S1RP73_9ACTN|nr:hypothetical protein [Parafrankia soli]OHV46594.1 hypothetical protein BBK14_01730 [Parafrankia soli]
MQHADRRGILAFGVLGALGIATGGVLVTDYGADHRDTLGQHLTDIGRDWERLSADQALARIDPIEHVLDLAGPRADSTWQQLHGVALIMQTQALIDGGQVDQAARTVLRAGRVAERVGDRQTAALAAVLDAEMLAHSARDVARRTGTPVTGEVPVQRMAAARRKAGRGPTAVIASTLLAQALAERNEDPNVVAQHLVDAEDVAGELDAEPGFGVWSIGHQHAFGGAALVRAGVLDQAGLWLHDAAGALGDQPGALAYVHLQQAHSAAAGRAWDEAYAYTQLATARAGERADSAWLSGGIAAIARQAGADWPAARV